MSDRPWQPEREPAIDDARQLVEAARPDLAGASIHALDPGWDNTAFLVDDEWVVRFPRRAIAVPLLETEARVLPRLAERLPTAIPRPTLYGPIEPFPWRFAVHRLVPGRDVATAALDDDRRAMLAEPIGVFLGALHDVDVAEASSLGAPPDSLRRLDVEHRAPTMAARMIEAKRLGLLDDVEPLERIVADATRSSRPPTTCLVHGDLDARHVLVDDRGVMTGVIDWGDVHVGHPAVDLGVVFGLLPPEAHDRFRSAYGPIDEATLALARFRAVHTALAVLLWGADTGRGELVRESGATLRRLTVETRRGHGSSSS